jgi:hypothetical protein
MMLTGADGLSRVLAKFTANVARKRRRSERHLRTPSGEREFATRLTRHDSLTPMFRNDWHSRRFSVPLL